MELFIIIDKNRLLNEVYRTSCWDNAVDHLLSLVNNHLILIKNHELKLNLDKMLFDNFVIIYTLHDNNNNINFIKNNYIFNLKSMNFIDFYGNNQLIPETCNYIKNCIISNLKNSQSPINHGIKKINLDTNKDVSDIKNPFKKLFDETSNILNNLNKDDCIHNKKLIPEIKNNNNLESDSNSDSDSESNLVSNSELNNDCEDNENNLKKNDNMEPKIRRQMDSIVFNKTSNTEKNIINDITNDMINNITNECEEIDTEELEKTIRVLKELKNQEQLKIEELKKQNVNDIENFSRYNDKLGDEKREFIKIKDREQQRRRVFEADKIAYRKMKLDISDGNLTEEKISEFFISKYPIIKFMDQKKLLDKEDDYIIYLNLYNEMYPQKDNMDEKNCFTPHNINYLSENDKEKYKNIKNDQKNIIEEFMKDNKNNNNKNKKYPSLTNVLESIDNNDSINLNSVNNINDDILDNYDNITFDHNKD